MRSIVLKTTWQKFETHTNNEGFIRGKIYIKLHCTRPSIIYLNLIWIIVWYNFHHFLKIVPYHILSKYYIFRYLNQIHGVSDPDPKVHESYLDVEPHLGALIGAQARFQANLILTPDPAFPPLANLTGTTVSFSTKNLL